MFSRSDGAIAVAAARFQLPGNVSNGVEFMTRSDRARKQDITQRPEPPRDLAGDVPKWHAHPQAGTLQTPISPMRVARGLPETLGCRYGGVGDGQGGVESGYALVDLSFGDDERRGDDEVGDPGLDRDAALHHFGGDLVYDQRRAGDFVRHGVERLF